MAIFDDVLLTVDYDRTLTGPDSVIPERNLEAIRYFMDNGGHFTVNTGRSTTTMKDLFYTVPTNAPFLLYNGTAFWQDGKLTNVQAIDLPMWEVLDAVMENFPEMNWEIQGLYHHHLLNPNPDFIGLYEKMHWQWEPTTHGQDCGPFVKFAAYGPLRQVSLKDMYVASDEDLARFAQLNDFILTRWGDKVETFFAAPRIIDIQAKGVSKGAAARLLKENLGKKILVCVGDAQNDVTMLEAADFAFCPADAAIADRYENVCNCGDGAVADVIYKKIPEILGILP